MNVTTAEKLLTLPNKATDRVSLSFPLRFSHCSSAPVSTKLSETARIRAFSRVSKREDERKGPSEVHGLNKWTRRSKDGISAKFACDVYKFLSIEALERFTRSIHYETERNMYQQDMLLFAAMFLCRPPFIALLDQHD